MATLSLYIGDCVHFLHSLKQKGRRFESVVSDIPYEVSQDTWDKSGIGHNPHMLRLVYDVLLPGGFAVLFAAGNKQHRLGSALEDAGFSINTCRIWKHNRGTAYHSKCVSKSVDKALGVPRAKVPYSLNGVKRLGNAKTTMASPRMTNALLSGVHYGDSNIPVTEQAKEAQGLMSSLKPSYEFMYVVQRPREGTMGENFLRHEVGGLNIGATKTADGWPTDFVETFEDAFDVDTFECAKASKQERGQGNIVATVKPIALMEEGVKLVLPNKSGTVVDMCMGSGTTGIAALKLGHSFIGNDINPEHVEYSMSRFKKYGFM